MNDKIVVLNSGGFDSIVLMNYLHYIEGKDNIYSLHFLYGARNEKQQLKCVNKVCEKIGANNYIISLPKFNWTNGNFYNKEYNSLESQYLEYRNLVFLSYAVSYAQSIGAKEIYCAFLFGNYNDVRKEFVEGFNKTIETSGIKLITPFSEYKYKDDLFPICTITGMTSEDYFSCDVPINDKPCGKCLDCKSLEVVEENLKIDKPIKALFQYGFDSSLFIDLLKKEPIIEIRALINNDCQLKCNHCFYGFSEMIGSKIPKEEYYKALKEGVDKLGVKNIHFSGKEPLFNDDILWYAKKIHDELNCTFNIVTNGINVPKYAEQLKKFGIERFYLSVDVDNGIRNSSSAIINALKSCQQNEIDVEIFIDLHKGNYNMIRNLSEHLLGDFSCIKSIYVRNIRRIGNAKNFEQLSAKQFNEVYKQLNFLSDKYSDKNFVFSLSKECEGIIDGDLLEMINFCESLYTCKVKINFKIFLEEYCSRFTNTVTLTPDGYLLGCASDVSLEDYTKVSSGNIKDKSLCDLVKLGREQLDTCNECYKKNFGDCYINSLKG